MKSRFRLDLDVTGLALYLPNEAFHIGRHVKLHSFGWFQNIDRSMPRTPYLPSYMQYRTAFLSFSLHGLIPRDLPFIYLTGNANEIS